MKKYTYCKKCNSEIADGMKFCTKCGAKAKGNTGKITAIASIALLVIVIAVAMSGETENTTTVSTNTTVTEESVLSIYKMLEDNEEMPFEIIDKAELMISENESLFKGNTSVPSPTFVNASIEYKHLNKNIDDYGDKLIYLDYAYVLSINETKMNENDTFTEIHLIDYDENSYYVFSQDKYSDIFDKDMVEFYGLPLAQSSFTNIDGGTTPVIVCASSYLKKIE